MLLYGLVLEGGEITHVRVGYVALALLGLRLVWGVVGPHEARYSAFPQSVGAAIRHVADIRAGRDAPHRSHNPLGALMICALWATLAVVAATGVAMELAPFPVVGEGGAHSEAAEAGHNGDDGREGGEGDEGEDMLEEVHETAAKLLLLLAALHVGGVVFKSRLTGVNLLRGMIRPDAR